MSQSVPTQHTAGDSFTATIDGSTYSAADGWVAQLVLIGSARYTLASSASGADHVATAAASATTAWLAETYSLRGIFTKTATSERMSTDLGRLVVLPDPESNFTNGELLKSPALVAFEALQAAYRAYLAAGQFHIQEYTINGRTMKFRSVAELLAALNAASREVEAEQAAARIAAGLSPRARFVVRM